MSIISRSIHVHASFVYPSLQVYFHSGMSQNMEEYELCLRAVNVILPDAGYFGVSAATGAIAGTFVSFRVRSRSWKYLLNVVFRVFKWTFLHGIARLDPGSILHFCTEKNQLIWKKWAYQHVTQRENVLRIFFKKIISHGFLWNLNWGYRKGNQMLWKFMWYQCSYVYILDLNRISHGERCSRKPNFLPDQGQSWIATSRKTGLAKRKISSSNGKGYWQKKSQIKMDIGNLYFTELHTIRADNNPCMTPVEYYAWEAQ